MVVVEPNFIVWGPVGGFEAYEIQVDINASFFSQQKFRWRRRLYTGDQITDWTYGAIYPPYAVADRQKSQHNVAETSHPHQVQPTVVEMAKVVLTGLITTCLGVFVALLAYAGSALPDDSATKCLLIVAFTLNSIALLLALFSSIISYLSEAWLQIFGQNERWWKAAVSCCILSLFSLILVFVFVGVMIGSA